MRPGRPADNTGGFSVTDVLPASLTFQTAASTLGASVSGQTVTYANTSGLTSGATETFTIPVKLSAAASNGSTRSNSAMVASTGTTDPNSGNNTSNTVTTTVQTRADLGVTNTSAPNPVIAGPNLTYFVVVANHGPSDAQTVTLSDPLPANTTLVSVTTPFGWTRSDWVWIGTSGTLAFRAATLAASATSTFTIVVKVASSVPNGTTLSDTATVHTATAEPSPDTTNPDSATVTTIVNTQADLGVTNNSAPNPVIAGSNATYTVVVTNHGPNDAQTVTLSDPLPANTTLVSANTPFGWSRNDKIANGANGTLTFSK